MNQTLCSRFWLRGRGSTCNGSQYSPKSSANHLVPWACICRSVFSTVQAPPGTMSRALLAGNTVEIVMMTAKLGSHGFIFAFIPEACKVSDSSRYYRELLIVSCLTFPRSYSTALGSPIGAKKNLSPLSTGQVPDLACGFVGVLHVLPRIMVRRSLTSNFAPS